MSVLNGTSTGDGEQLYSIILKSVHNCRSYGADKFGCAHPPPPQTVIVDNYVSLTASGCDKNAILQLYFSLQPEYTKLAVF